MKQKIKLRALKTGFDGFQRIRGPAPDGSTEGEVFDHDRITLNTKEVNVGTAEKPRMVKKLVMPAWCDVVDPKDRDKFIYQDDRDIKIREGVEKMAKEVEEEAKKTVQPQGGGTTNPPGSENPSQ